MAGYTVAAEVVSSKMSASVMSASSTRLEAAAVPVGVSCFVFRTFVCSGDHSCRQYLF